MNLLQETKDEITKSGHTEDDIVFIGSEISGHECSWKEFCKLSDVEYDESFGAQEVATDLIIVFSDGHEMRRGEYDGAEWWEHIVPFVRPEQSHPIKHLICKPPRVGYENLAKLNTPKTRK